MMSQKKKDIATNAVQENCEELTKEKNRTVYQIIVLVFAVCAVIVALTIAWFVSNTSVQFHGTGISADMKSVELKTYGGSGIHDDLLKRMMDQEKTWYEKAVSFLGTSPEKYAVNWLLSDESEIGNYSTEQSDWESYWKDPEHQRQDQAIEPGSEGKLKFFVVPGQDGDITVNMQLSLLPYFYDNDQFVEANEVARNFVSGHILFFLEEPSASGGNAAEGNQSANLCWLPDGSFSIRIADAKKDQEYPYTLYWCWLRTFGEMMLAEGDVFLNNKTSLFSEYANGEAMRETIARGDAYSMMEMPQRYFYSSLTQDPLPKDQAAVQQIGGIYGKSLTDMSEDAKNAFVDLSSYYNQADRYIGSHANCLRVKLEMQPLLQDESEIRAS